MKSTRKAWIALCVWALLLCQSAYADDSFWFQLYGWMSGQEAGMVKASTLQPRRVPQDCIIPESGLEWIEYGTSKGVLTINWSYAGQTNPVAYAAYVNRDESVSESGSQSAEGTLCTLSMLIPGQPYTITLYDASHEPLAQWNVEIVLVEIDTSWVEITRVGVTQTDWANAEFDAIWIDAAPSASAILNDRAAILPYQFAVEFESSPLYGKEQTCERLLCVRAPGGETFKSHDTITFEVSEHWTSWKSGFMRIDPNTAGLWLTPGTYTVQMYLDGVLEETATFEMSP